MLYYILKMYYCAILEKICDTLNNKPNLSRYIIRCIYFNAQHKFFIKCQKLDVFYFILKVILYIITMIVLVKSEQTQYNLDNFLK